MPAVHCFTSISYSYLDRARVLAETVRKFHPDWILWLCLSDREPHGFALDIQSENFDHLVRIDDLAIPDLERWIFGHNVVELCTAVKGAMLCHMLEHGAEKVVYIDPDIALFDTLDDIPRLLDRHDIVLTPHLTAPEATIPRILDNEIGALKHGTFNLGFIAVSARDDGRRFATWWKERLQDFCYDDIPAGLFTDQRWCDLVPSLFGNTHILRDPGYNVASWNLINRPIEIHWDGRITAGGHPLRFFHFTKINSVGEAALTQNADGRHEVFELVRWYRARLAANAAEHLPPGWWAFARYGDGTSIPAQDRTLYRRQPGLREQFQHPFASGPGSFQDWCAHQATA